jgi:exodeoxyribonuclease V beta subunit
MKPLDPSRVPLTGRTLIEASAGTGKTYTITTLVLRLLVEAKLSIEQILVVTYTRAATAELRDRLRVRLRVAIAAVRGKAVDDAFVRELVARAEGAGERRLLGRTLEKALAEIDQAPVLTIHGFCQRALADHAFESGSAWNVRLTAHAKPLLDEIADDYYVRELSDARPERILALDRNEPDKLRALAGRASHELELWPRELGSVPLDRQRWDAARRRCAELLEQERDTIVQLGKLAISRNARYMEGWVGTLARAFASAEPGSLTTSKELEAPLRNFSRSEQLDKRAPGKPEPPNHPFFEAADELRREDARYAESAAATRVAFRKGFVGYLGSQLVARTRQKGVRTFDALLSDLDAALGAPGSEPLLSALRDSYRAALVDEFQDTDPLQYRIFRRIFEGGAPLFVIGDPKQAIYAFRGADVYAYLAARGDAGEQSFTLDVNRRSDTALVGALNQLYARVERPFAVAGIDYQPVRTPEQLGPRFRARDGGAPLEVLVTAAERGADERKKLIAEQVASEIVRLLDGPAERLDDGAPGGPRFRRLRPSDVAVLCRMNAEAQLVQEALSARKVPSVFQGDESVLDSSDAVELERVLRALAHPGDARALRSFLSSIYGGHDAAALLALEADDRAWDRHRARFTQLHDLWLEHGFIQALRGLVVTYDVERTLLARPDGPRRMTNLWHLCELLSEAALEQRLGPLGLLRWLLLVRADDTLRSELVGDAHELRLESNADAVRLTTVHKSKGLEYPVVFLPFAWDTNHLRGEDGTFPRFHQGGRLTLDLAASETSKAEAKREGLAEALRLLYVGLTRAKHRVYVVAPAIKDFGQSALGYTLLGGTLVEGSALESAPEAGELCAQLGARLGSEQVRVRRFSEPAATLLASRGSAQVLSVRGMKRELDAVHRTSSFSALTSRARGAHAELGLDHDGQDAVAEARPAMPPSPLLLDAFPRGAGPGQLVHEVLELADFAMQEPELDALVQATLASRAYGQELSPMLSRGLLRVLATPLAPGLSLAAVPRSRRLDELEFLLPVQSTLQPRKLEQLLRAHRAPAADPAYAARLRGLSFEALRGYLRGFIDLVFEHEGRFYVVDYKSNHLGSSVDDYAPERLCEAMAEHHYHLQYLLYVAAVHCYLAQRVPRYDYDTHFGGVYYLFLRGMDPDHPPGSGIFHERPTRALITELVALLHGEEAAS